MRLQLSLMRSIAIAVYCRISTWILRKPMREDAQPLVVERIELPDVWW